MNEKIVSLAVPVFFLLIGVELLVLRLAGKRGYYRFPDSIANFSCGVGQQVLDPFFRFVVLVPYTWLYEHHRVTTMHAESPLAWVLLILGIDLGYYVFHRSCHRIGFLWAVHAVHHQSEEYNLAVALRQPWLESLVSPLFYLPMALLGFPPVMYLLGVTIDVLYQFWIHTRTVPKLGPIEWIFNTPSHHRVHHGIDPEYLDRNYAGIFILWDRLLGTYQREEREPVYGTVKVVSTWNPLTANFAPWRDLWKLSASTGRFVDKLRIWIAPPEWRPVNLGGPVVVAVADPKAYPRYDVKATSKIRLYVAVQFALLSLATVAYQRAGESQSKVFLSVAAAALVGALVAWGGLLEQRKWAWALEAGRVLLSVGAIGWWWMGHA